MAPDEVDEDSKGRDRLAGYFCHVALTYPRSFVMLLGCLLRIQEATGTDDEPVETVYKSVEEAQQALKERGITRDILIDIGRSMQAAEKGGDSKSLGTTSLEEICRNASS